MSNRALSQLLIASYFDIAEFFLSLFSEGNTNEERRTMMSRIEKNKLNFTVALIAEFAATYQIKQKQAFNYLNRFKGLVFYKNTMK